jgi:hypothetical protein
MFVAFLGLLLMPKHPWVDLPKVGIKGNSHMIMMDKNSDEVAAYIQAWLARQGLFR